MANCALLISSSRMFFSALQIIFVSMIKTKRTRFPTEMNRWLWNYILRETYQGSLTCFCPEAVWSSSSCSHFLEHHSSLVSRSSHEHCFPALEVRLWWAATIFHPEFFSPDSDVDKCVPVSQCAWSVNPWWFPDTETGEFLVKFETHESEITTFNGDSGWRENMQIWKEKDKNL